MNNSSKRLRYYIGVSDYVKRPYDVESAAFPEAQFVELNEEDERLWDPKIISKLDGLLVWHAHIGNVTATQLKRNAIVVRYGVGYDAINVSELANANIMFCNTPDYGTEEVADTTCAMVLNLQRKVSAYDFSCRYYKDGWQEHVLPPLKRTNKQKLGIIGVGRIGTAVINRLKAFGYEIHGYDPYQPSGHEKSIGYIRHDNLGSILEHSDTICICCLLNDETRGMVNKDFIQKMKPGSNLVITSRGGLIDNLAIIEQALKSGKLLGVGLDVLPQEPPDKESSLIKSWQSQEGWIRGRLLINPHTSYYSEEALYEMRYKAAETARMYLMDGKLRNQILI
jgi:D-3-phosphoglycerate dehydrogenase